MKKTLILILLISFVIILGGCSHQTPPKPSVNNNTDNEEVNVNNNQNFNQNTNQDNQLIGSKKEPAQIVQDYVNNTLIVKPRNYPEARKSLTPELQKQFDEISGFVPQSYGIQDEPLNVTMGGAKIEGTSATVEAVGHYGESDVVWKFTLKLDQGEWSIASYAKVVNGDENVPMWQTYENKKINLMFSYPDDFKITTDSAGQVWPNGDQSQKIILTHKENSDIKFQVEANVDGYGPFFPDTIYSIEDTEAGKINIVSKTLSDSPNADDGVGFISTKALTSKNGQNYNWKIWYEDNDTEMPKIFDEILESTRLTK